MSNNNKNIVCINSPTYKGVIYKYIMTDEQLKEYNYITNDGSVITLKVFGELNRKGLLGRRFRDNVSSIKL